MLSYSQVNLTFCSTLTLTFEANNRLCPVHNIQAYFGKFSLIDVSKILALGKLFKVKVKVIFGAASHRLKYEIKVSVTIRCKIIAN